MTAASPSSGRSQRSLILGNNNDFLDAEIRLLIVPFAVPMPVRMIFTLLTSIVLARLRLGIEVPGNQSIIAPARAFGPYYFRSHMMILRQKMNIDCIDHFSVAGWMTFPVAVGLPIRRTFREIVNIGPKVKVQCDVRPAHAAPSQIHYHCRVDARPLCHEKRYRDLVGRQCALAD